MERNKDNITKVCSWRAAYLVKTGNWEPIICNRTNKRAIVVRHSTARRRDASHGHAPEGIVMLLLPSSERAN